CARSEWGDWYFDVW
nr:immunoglobulin heavy chain junction region [Mus musculus]MBK4185796.1 immunoglobulin heavy chain junction region [Mus musculus]